MNIEYLSQIDLSAGPSSLSKYLPEKFISNCFSTFERKKSYKEMVSLPKAKAIGTLELQKQAFKIDKT